MRFIATIRYWRPEQAGGLAVNDIPPDYVAELGGLRQMRVRGTINGAGFQSSVMPAGAGRLALSVTKAMMKSGGAEVGTVAEFGVEPIAPPE